MSDAILHTRRSILKEIFQLSILCFAVLLLLALFGLSGSVEQKLHVYFFSRFSWGSFLFPAALLWVFRPSGSRQVAQEEVVADNQRQKPIEPLEGADELFEASLSLAEELGAISTKSLRKRFSIGHGRAKAIVEEMDRQGMLSEQTDGVGRRLFALPS